MSDVEVSTAFNDFYNQSSDTDSVGAIIYHYGMFGLITCVNIPGNLLVITTFLRHDALRKPSNFFIVGLSSSDLCLGVVYPVYIVGHLHSVEIERTLGQWRVCEGIMITICALLFCSSFHLLAITITRYLSVVKPFMYRRYITNTVAVRSVMGIWVLSLSISLLIYCNGEPIENYEHDCMYEKIFGVKRISLLFALALGVPLIVMVLLYIQIARVARQHVKTTNKKSCRVQKSGREWRATTTVAVLLGVFAGVWTPMFIYFYANYFCGGCIETPYVRATIRILVYMNTAVNVFIYSLRMECFRNAVKKDFNRFRSIFKRQSDIDTSKADYNKFTISGAISIDNSKPDCRISVSSNCFVHI